MIFKRLTQIGFAAAVMSACHVPSTAQIELPTAEDVAAAPDDWREVEPENLVLMETTKGRIILELLPEAAPAHVEHFKAYVRDGLYDNTAFHRVIQGFMAQGGDVEAAHGADKMLEPLQAEFTFRRNPNEFPIDTIGPADSASAGFYKGFPIRTQAQFLAEMSIDGEVESWIPHCPGVLSSARTDDPNSANAQFFLISEDGQHLDREYTAKGRVLQGLDVVQGIKLGPTPNGFPISNPDILQRAKLFTDLEPDARPRVYVQKTEIQAWQERRAAADQTRAKICTLPRVPAVVIE
ncbi:MAG: peptidylprolyl isomerase [Pseudomonadota bacterium]